MKDKIEFGLRLLIGFMLAFSGLNKLFGFMPLPDMGETGNAFMLALDQSIYIELPTFYRTP